MTLSECKFFNDSEGRAAFLRQLSFLLIPASHALPYAKFRIGFLLFSILQFKFKLSKRLQ